MTRTPYPPQRHHSHLVEVWGHWEGDYECGEYVDRFVEHCPAHRDHLRDGCAMCAEHRPGGTDDARVL